jgi:hypothetical protein
MTFPHNDADDFDFGGTLSADDAPQSYQPIPAGKYAVVAANVHMKDSKAGGKMLAVTFELTEQYQGRKVFEHFNLGHAKEDVREIARRQIGQLLAATGADPDGFPLRFGAIKEAIEGVEVLATISIDTGKVDYEPQNRIKKYEEYANGVKPAAREEAPAERPAPPPRKTQVPPPAATAAAPAKRPWDKG